VTQPLKTTRQRCTAQSKQKGQQCGSWAIEGGTVCRHHGGRAPQVQAKARERLAKLVDPAISALARAIEEGEVRDIIRAAQVVLDRTGFGPQQSVEIGGKLTHAHTLDVRLLCDSCLRKVRAELGE
jgi:hypothetical protein